MPVQHHRDFPLASLNLIQFIIPVIDFCFIPLMDQVSHRTGDFNVFQRYGFHSRDRIQVVHQGDRVTHLFVHEPPIEFRVDRPQFQVVELLFRFLQSIRVTFIDTLKFCFRRLSRFNLSL